MKLDRRQDTVLILTDSTLGLIEIGCMRSITVDACVYQYRAHQATGRSTSKRNDETLDLCKVYLASVESRQRFATSTGQNESSTGVTGIMHS